MIGGNGAIGVRLVEQLVMMHNSTANIYAVDIAPQPFSLPIDATHFPHAANRFAYRQLPRYLVSDGCRPIVLDRPLSAPCPGGSAGDSCRDPTPAGYADGRRGVRVDE